MNQLGAVADIKSRQLRDWLADKQWVLELLLASSVESTYAMNM